MNVILKLLAVVALIAASNADRPTNIRPRSHRCSLHDGRNTNQQNRDEVSAEVINPRSVFMFHLDYTDGESAYFDLTTLPLGLGGGHDVCGHYLGITGPQLGTYCNLTSIHVNLPPEENSDSDTDTHSDGDENNGEYVEKLNIKMFLDCTSRGLFVLEIPVIKLPQSAQRNEDGLETWAGNNAATRFPQDVIEQIIASIAGGSLNLSFEWLNTLVSNRVEARTYSGARGALTKATVLLGDEYDRVVALCNTNS